MEGYLEINKNPIDRNHIGFILKAESDENILWDFICMDIDAEIETAESGTMIDITPGQENKNQVYMKNDRIIYIENLDISGVNK